MFGLRKMLALGSCIVILSGLTNVPMLFSDSPISQGERSEEWAELRGVPLHSQCAVNQSDPFPIDYDYFNQDVSSIIEDIELREPVIIHFFEQDLKLLLEESGLISQDSNILIWHENQTLELPAPSIAYNGIVVDPPGNETIMTLTDSSIYGYARVGDYVYYDEVAPFDLAPPNEPYRAWKVYSPTQFNYSSNDSDEGCPGDTEQMDAQKSPTENLPNGIGILTVVEQTIFLVADREYMSLYECRTGPAGSRYRCAYDRMIGDMNFVNAIFSKAQVRFTVKWAVMGYADGGMTSTDRIVLLGQFRDFMDNNLKPLGQYHVAHLFTGKNLDGLYLGRGGGHHSLSQQVEKPGGTYKADWIDRAMLEAHELGHCYGARHDWAVCYAVLWICAPPYIGWVTVMWSPFYGWPTSLPAFSNQNSQTIHTNAHVKDLWPPP